MTEAISPRRCGTIADEGYAVVRGFFAPAEVAAIAAAFDRHWRDGMAHRASFRHGNLFYRQGRDPRLGKILRLVQWPAYVDPTLEAVRRDPRWLDLLEPLLGRDIKQIINQLHWKPPGAAGGRIRLPSGCALPPAALGLSQSRALLCPDRHRHRSAPRPTNGAMRLCRARTALGEREVAGAGPVLDQAMAEERLSQRRARSRAPHRSRARAGRRRAVEPLHHPRLGPQPHPRPTAASISTAMSAPPIATAANGRSAPARRCRWARPRWSITRISSPAPSRTTSNGLGLGGERGRVEEPRAIVLRRGGQSAG